MTRQLFIAQNDIAKKAFEKVDKPFHTDYDLVTDFAEVKELKKRGKLFSLIVIDSPIADELSKLKEWFTSSTILVTYPANAIISVPDFAHELIYTDPVEGFEKLLYKRLNELDEVVRLRAKQKFDEVFFERLEIPMLIAVRNGQGDYEVSSYNNAFLEHSLTNTRLKHGDNVDVLSIYSIKPSTSFNEEGIIRAEKTRSRNGNKYTVDVSIFKHRLKASNANYLVATEVERRISEKELLRLKERIEFVENSKKTQQEFLASVAHDLRKPLNNIIGLVQLLSDSGLKEEQSFIANSLIESSDVLKNLLSDVLDNSAIDSGHFEILNELFELRPLVESIKTMFLNDAQEKGVDFTTELNDAAPVWLIGDKNRLSQVLINLISNALKFTEKGGVRLIVEFNKLIKDKAHLSFKVIDTGIGIAKENQESIFESYNQGSKGTNSKFGGTGLGLTITKKLTTLMGGKLSLKSELNKGSEFTAEISFGVSTVNDTKTNEQNISLSNLNILVVDDNEIAAFVLSKLISKSGGKSFEAYTGYDAIKTFEKEQIDLVITDIQLPDINGIRLSSRLKSIAAAKGRTLPIIGLSAFPFPKRLEKEGFLDFFALKPISKAHLIKKIEETYSNARDIKTTAMNYRVIDTKHIKSFTGGDPEFIKQLVDIFLKRTPEYMDELKAAVNAKDWDKIKSMAHKLKPTFTYVGMGSFTNKVGSIEDYAIKKDIDTITNILDEVWDDCQLAFDEFEDFVKSID